MEHLTSPHPDDDRQFFLIVVEQFEEIPARLQTTSPYFALLVAIDFAGDSPGMRDAIKRLIGQGLAYFSSRGAGCEALHDLVDRVGVESGQFHPSSSPENVLMTVWNSNGALEETMWDFAHASCIAQRYVDDCKTFIVAAQPRYTERIRTGWAVATLPE